jgi:hypothetical protein
MPKLGWLAAARALALIGCCLLAVPATGYADRCDEGPHGGSLICASPVPASTPELSSLVLFGTGLLGLGGVAYVRRRGESPPEPPTER